MLGEGTFESKVRIPHIILSQKKDKNVLQQCLGCDFIFCSVTFMLTHFIFSFNLFAVDIFSPDNVILDIMILSGA